MIEPFLSMIERVLSVWRISNMLVEEDGPGLIFRRVREWSGVEHDSEGNKLSWNDYTPLHCTYCTSVWVVALTWFAPNWFHRLMAISAGAILIDVIESFVQKYSREEVGK